MPQTKEKSKGIASITGSAVRLGRIFALSLIEAGYDGKAWGHTWKAIQGIPVRQQGEKRSVHDFYYKPDPQPYVEVLNTVLVIVAIAEVVKTVVKPEVAISVLKSKGVAVIWIIIAVVIRVAILGTAVSVFRPEVIRFCVYQRIAVKVIVYPLYKFSFNCSKDR